MPRALYHEMRLLALLLHIGCLHVGIRINAVGDDRPGDFLKYMRHFRVIKTQHRETVKRQVMQELDKGLAQPIKITLVARQVVGINICHYGH